MTTFSIGIAEVVALPKIAVAVGDLAGLARGRNGRILFGRPVAGFLAILLAIIFLKERVNWQVILGAFMMAGGAILIAFTRPAE